MTLSGLGFAQTAIPGWKELALAPAKSGGQNRGEGVAIRLDSTPIRTLVAHAYGLPWHGLRIEGPAALDREVSITAVPETSDPAAAREALKTLLAERCRLAAHWEKRTVPVQALRLVRAQAAKTPQPDRLPPSMTVVHGSIKGVGPIAALVPHIEYRANAIIVDETGLSAGNYRLDLTWEGGNVDSFMESLGSQLGLELANARREVEMLIVDQIEFPAGR